MQNKKCALWWHFRWIYMVKTQIRSALLNSLGRRGGGGGRVGRFIRDPFPLFCSGGYRQQFRHGQVCSIFQVVRSAFPLPTKASPILQSVLKDGFGEAVVTLDMLEPCEFPSLDSCMGARGCLESGFPETEKNGRIPNCKIRTRYCEK